MTTKNNNKLNFIFFKNNYPTSYNKFKKFSMINRKFKKVFITGITGSGGKLLS